MKTGITSGVTGADVGELQSALTTAGFTIDANEVASQAFGPSTLAALNGFQQQKKLAVGNVVDAATAASLAAIAAAAPIATGTGVTAAVQGTVVAKPNATVTGTLVDGDGASVANTKVSLFSEVLRAESHVADATTDARGVYTIAYGSSGSMNLLVRAYDAKGTVIATSATMFSAPSQVEIDFTTAADGAIRALSTFATLSAAVSAVLQKVAVTDLEENSSTHEVRFVANASGMAFADVSQLVVASAIAAKNKLRPETLFGLFRQGIPATLDQSLASLPATGLDDAFASQTLAKVLAHSRSSIAAALTAAVAANDLPASYAQMQNNELAQLDALRVAQVGTAPFGNGTATSLADLLAAGSVSAAATTAFTKAYADSGALAGALQTVQAAISDADLTTLANTLALGLLLSGNVPLVKDATQRITQKTLANVSDLALLAASDWSTRITAVDPQAASIPPVSPNETVAQKIARFSSALASQLAGAHPTTAFRGGLASAQTSAFATKSELVSVLAANPTLELLQVAIDQFVAANKVTISSAALGELKTAQRLMRLVPAYASIDALKSAGFQSAQSIYVAGRGPFLARMTTPLGTEADAQLVYARAQMTYAAALATWARFNGALNNIAAKALPAPAQPDPVTQSWPDIQQLFGSRSYFECADCQSVLSPAAYLVDLLSYLRQFTATTLPATTWPAGTTPPSTATDALLLRRPDIANIALDCNNTNIAIPYIDLVNEILETFVANATPAAVIETTGTSAERRALALTPLPDAYARTAGAVFPFSLPFDLPFAQTTSYLAALGTSRRHILERMRASAEAIAGAALGVNPSMQPILGGSLASKPWAAWGVADSESSTWVATLGKVPALLQRAGLTLPQLYQLLEAEWVTGGVVALQLGTDPSTGIVSADLAAMSFTGLTADVLGRAQQFLRVAAASCLQMWELDWALPSGSALDEPFLEFLVGAKDVAAKLSLPFADVLSFWGPISTRDVTDHLGDEDTVVSSVYTAVFGNAALIAAGSPLPADGSTLTALSLTDAATVNAITAALGISASDIAAVAATIPASSTSKPLVVVGTLLSYARLARALSLSIPDLLLWIQLAGETSLGGTPAVTLELLRRIAVLRGTGLGVYDADYLLRGTSAPQSSIALTAQAIAALLQSIHDALAKLTDAQKVDATTVQTVVVQALATATGATAAVIAPLYAKTPSLAFDSSAITSLLAVATPDPTQFSAIVAGFTSVARGVALYTATRATEVEFAQLVANAGVFSWLDPSSLPSTPTSPYAQLEALLRALRLNRRQPARTPRLFDVLDAWQQPGQVPGDVATALSGQLSAALTIPSLASALAGTVTDVSAIALALGATAPSITATTQAGTLADMAMLTAIADALDLAARYSLSGATLVQLASAAPDGTVATAARAAFQAQYAQSAWLAAVQPVEDSLRQQRRDALVAYLLGGGREPAGVTFASTDDIFDYFLIDPEMCACGVTTRLLQASLAIQQFVQQCMLGVPIQAAVDQTSSAWSEWSWRGQFRLWQANRQVFLYPENYLLPELRKDSSPLFESLESDLRQNNCTDDLAEVAFENYLRGLLAASNLVVAAQYNEVRPNDDTVLHVFAHTRATPYQWSYRTRTKSSADSAGTWSAWQSLGLDIPSDQVVPIVWGNRLHLVWPVFSIASEKAQTQTIPNSPYGSKQSPPQTFWVVQLAISELSAGQWQPKQAIDQKLFFVRSVPETSIAMSSAVTRTIAALERPADAFTFRAAATATESLEIRVYYNPGQYEAGGERIVAIANLPSLEAPLQVTQLEYSPVALQSDGRGAYPVTPESGSVDLSQEPTFAQVHQTADVSGSLSAPALYGFSGQDLVIGTFDQPRPTGSMPVNVLAPEYSASPSTVEVLGQTFDPHVVVPPQEAQFDSADPFFVIDAGNGAGATPRPARTYVVDTQINVPPVATSNGTASANSSSNALVRLQIAPRPPAFTFSTFYHPYARELLRQLEVYGLPQLMSRSFQMTPSALPKGRGWALDFQNAFSPLPVVSTPYPGQSGSSDAGETSLDYAPYGAYSLYNWEVFYHAPMFVAELLMQNRQYGDAMKWLEYIFDPSDSSSNPAPQRYWEAAPLFDLSGTDWTNQQIQTILQNIATGSADPGTTASLAKWATDPFDPHAIAELRISAYGKATVMKFLDNLIAWGDSLFATYTAETVGQAEQLYVLADMLLGLKPAEVRMPPQPPSTPPTWTQLAPSILDGDEFPDPLVAVENLVVAPTPPQWLVDGTGSMSLPFIPASSNAKSLLFCIPPNDKLLAYWDTVADRLYKIRHCLNLQGQAVPLPLYAPAINPLLAVEGASAGQVPTGLEAPAPIYRFSVYLQKAIDLANDVRQFGGLILSALEKEDAESLALLHANQELDIQQRVLDVKTKQVTEAQDQITALQDQKALAQIRYNFYSTIAFMNPWETEAMALQVESTAVNTVAAYVLDSVSPLNFIPLGAFGAAGFGGAPYATASYGGANLASAASSAAEALHADAGLLSEAGGMVATIGSYQRRADEWQLQASLASAEMTQIDSQIAAANDRLAIAQSELAIQSQTIANAQAIRNFLANKYTQVELYDWMVTQLTTVFAQAYQLAFSMALQSQYAYQYELGRPTDSFIQFGYWDAQHRGLTAGESLLFDLRRMETQYLANNTREFELTKSVSLALTQPAALIGLVQTGTCSIVLDEALFDADHPGHYFRRLRDVSITIPFVGGPYTGANATLTLTKCALRTSDASTGYTSLDAASLAAATSTSAVTVTLPSGSPGSPIPAIATSTGQGDSGLFEVSFRDERLLPFEGRGAVSMWTFELNPADNQFDFSTISDVVLHVRYTARPGLDAATVRKQLPAARSIYISAKASFSDAWQAFLNPGASATQQALTLAFGDDKLPFSNLGPRSFASVQPYVVLDAATTAALPATFGLSSSTTLPALSFQGSATVAISMLSAPAVAITGPLAQALQLTVPIATIPDALSTTTASGQKVLDPAKIRDVVLIVNCAA